MYHHLFGSNCQEGPDTGEAIIESGLACTTQCQARVRCKQCLTIYTSFINWSNYIHYCAGAQYTWVSKESFPASFWQIQHDPPSTHKQQTHILQMFKDLENISSNLEHGIFLNLPHGPGDVPFSFLSPTIWLFNCSLCVRFWLCLCCNRMASTSQTRCCDATQRREETQMSSCTLWRRLTKCNGPDICPIFPRLTPATFTCEAPCTVPTVSNSATGGICKEAIGRMLGEWGSRYCSNMHHVIKWPSSKISPLPRQTLPQPL